MSIIVLPFFVLLPAALVAFFIALIKVINRVRRGKRIQFGIPELLLLPLVLLPWAWIAERFLIDAPSSNAFVAVFSAYQLDGALIFWVASTEESDNQSWKHAFFMLFGSLLGAFAGLIVSYLLFASRTGGF